MRVKPNVVYRLWSPNVSERTTDIRGIVLHSTESMNVDDSQKDLQGVASWFHNDASEVSAHVITDSDGNSARCVRDDDKAWHCAAYNSQTLGIEQIGYARQGKEEWLRDEKELREVARWIAKWSAQHGIPIRKGRALNGRIVLRGVLTHKQLGSYGGNHSDPGSYPLGKVLRMARKFKKQLETNGV